MTATHRKRKLQESGTSNTAAPEEDGIGVRYHCDACQKDVTHVVRVRCSVCVDFDLCVECHAQGITFGAHDVSHPYRVMDTQQYPVYEANWTAQQESLLLEAIEMFGLGNWAACASHLGNRHTKEECMRHYMEVYVSSNQFPEPDPNRYVESMQVVPNTQTTSGPLSPKTAAATSTTAAKSSKAASNSSSNRQSSKALHSQPSHHEIAGYMPCRHEFETEHDNEAEMAVKDLVFHNDDSSADTQAQLTLLEIYNQRLDQRYARRQFVFERGLIQFKKHQALDRARPKEARDLYQAVRPFARFQTADDFDQFYHGLALEQEYRARIATLQQYRRHGITRFAQGHQFEVELRAREQFLKQQKNREHSYFAAQAPSLMHQVRQWQQQQQQLANSGTPTANTLSSVAQSYVTVSNTKSSVVPKTKTPLSVPTTTPSLPLDISNATETALLSPSERELCEQLRVLPKTYLAVKKSLLLTAMQSGGYLARQQALQMIRMEPVKTARIFDWMLSCGWIKLPPTQSQPQSLLTSPVINNSALSLATPI